MIITRKTLMGIIAAGLLNFASCADEQQTINEAIQSEGQEASEQENQSDDYSQQDDYIEEDLQQESESYYSDEEGDESPEVIAEELIDAEPSYADDSALSYGGEKEPLTVGGEDAKIDLSDSSDDASVAMPAVDEPTTVSTTIRQREYAAPASSDVYIVQPGDTLTSIAKKIYKDGARWAELASMNNLSHNQIIYPGDKINFDSGDNNAESFVRDFNNSLLTVTVQSGDTLSSIAQKIFNDGGAWRYIYQLNADKISNPDQIFAGQVLSYATPQSSPMTH